MIQQLHAYRLLRTRRRRLGLFGFNALHHRLDFFVRQQHLDSTFLDDTQLHRLGPRIDDFQQGLCGQANALVLGHVGSVLLLEELAEGLGVASANDLGLPAAVGSSGVGLVQKGAIGLGGIGADAGHECGNAKGTHSSLLGVLLLYLCEVSGHVVDVGSVFHGEAVGLCFRSYLIDEDSGVGGQSSEREDCAIIDRDDFANGSIVLESAEVSEGGCL